MFIPKIIGHPPPFLSTVWKIYLVRAFSYKNLYTTGNIVKSKVTCQGHDHPHALSKPCAKLDTILLGALIYILVKQIGGESNVILQVKYAWLNRSFTHLYYYDINIFWFYSDLRTFRVTACGLSENEWTQLAEIRDNYTTMIQERALDFRFTTDLIVDFSWNR